MFVILEVIFFGIIIGFLSIGSGAPIFSDTMKNANNRNAFDFYQFAYNESVEQIDVVMEDCDPFEEQRSNTGKKVSQWIPGSGINVDELGEYPGGDVLHPPNMDPSRNGINNPIFLWPNKIIPLVIHSSVGQNELTRIKEAIGYYHQNTCIRFKQRSNETDYVIVTSNDEGCYTDTVGRTGGQNRMNLQSPNCFLQIGVVLHEMMHAAGFYHEHTRWERDNYVTINFQNIIDDPNARYQFQKIPRNQTNDQGVEYDYASIMHYGRTSASKNGKPTITPKKNVEIGQRRFFSQGDLTKLNRLYSC